MRPILLALLREGISRRQLLDELLAGTVVGVVALPLAIAFAIASGLPPSYGLYTAIIAGFLASLLGGSRVQVTGPTGAFVVVVYGIVAEHGVEGLALATILAGGILALMGLVRLGHPPSLSLRLTAGPPPAGVPPGDLFCWCGTRVGPPPGGAPPHPQFRARIFPGKVGPVGNPTRSVHQG
jgi:hypothetical protein